MADNELDLARLLQIWKWLLDPNINAKPEEITPEELTGVFCRNVLLLQNFNKLLKGSTELHQLLERRKSGHGPTSL